MANEEGNEFENQVEYAVHGKVAVITLNRPDALNAMNQYHYWAWDEAVQRAANERGTVATILQSSGRYFSAGADVRSGSSSAMLSSSEDGSVDTDARRQLAGAFVGRNTIIADTFWNHPKVLIVALNGPVVGLTAALVAMADFVLARESAFLLVPFANLSLVTEGASGFMLPQRLGLSLANQALLASQPIQADALYRVGFVNELYPASLSTETFNAEVLKYAQDRFEKLDPDSLKLIKQIVHAPYEQAMGDVITREVIGGLDRFARGLPQQRFLALAQRAHKHKL